MLKVEDKYSADMTLHVVEVEIALSVKLSKVRVYCTYIFVALNLSSESNRLR